jgi:hypothetical protein
MGELEMKQITIIIIIIIFLILHDTIVDTPAEYHLISFIREQGVL